MPKITVEKLIKITEDIYEVKEKTYILPEKIILNGVSLSYDSYHKAYISRNDDMYITAEEYLAKKLSNENKKHSEDKYEVTAIPGPAIVISKETYKKMQENSTAQQNQERLKEYKKFFKNITDKTKKQRQEEELTL